MAFNSYQKGYIFQINCQLKSFINSITHTRELQIYKEKVLSTCFFSLQSAGRQVPECTAKWAKTVMPVPWNKADNTFKITKWMSQLA